MLSTGAIPSYFCSLISFWLRVDWAVLNAERRDCPPNLKLGCTQGDESWVETEYMPSMYHVQNAERSDGFLHEGVPWGHFPRALTLGLLDFDLTWLCINPM